MEHVERQKDELRSANSTSSKVEGNALQHNCTSPNKIKCLFDSKYKIPSKILASNIFLSIMFLVLYGFFRYELVLHKLRHHTIIEQNKSF